MIMWLKTGSDIKIRIYVVLLKLQASKSHLNVIYSAEMQSF